MHNLCVQAGVLHLLSAHGALAASSGQAPFALGLAPVKQRLLGQPKLARSLGNAALGRDHTHRFLLERERVFRPNDLLQNLFLFSVVFDLRYKLCFLKASPVAS